MRIVAGDFKGRRLNAPSDKLVRPTTEKVKEALFSIIAPELYDARVCDLFAGTGSLGLEALSRGAGFCWFSDHAGESIKMIKDNVEMCGAQESSMIIHGDYRKALDRIKGQVDIFLLDPPYGRGLIEKAMEIISEKELLAPDGLIAAEHHRDDNMEDRICGFTKIKEKRYGRVVLSIYM